MGLLSLKFIRLKIGAFDISEVGFEDMAVGHVPVKDGTQQEEGIHNNGVDEPKVEGFS